MLLSYEGRRGEGRGGGEGGEGRGGGEGRVGRGVGRGVGREGGEGREEGHTGYIVYIMCSYRINSLSHSHSFSLKWLWNHISHQNGAQRPISRVIDLMGLVAVGNFRDGLWELVCMFLCLLDLARVVQLKISNHTSSVENSPRALQMMDAAGGRGRGRNCDVE